MDEFGNETTAPQSERIAYCQDCGKPLTADTIRNVGSGVFCEPCLVNRVGGTAPPMPPAGGTYAGGFGTPPPNAYTSTADPQRPATHLPNPTLAGFLGLIPGVGAMYNGQFAKGIAHLVIFFVLSSLSDHVNGAFGILVAGWIFYQAFEAYHTAKARLLGDPLPNPLGLNDIGDRMGFGKTTPAEPQRPYTPPSTPWTPPAPAAAPVPPVPPANWAGYVPPVAFTPAPPPVSATQNATWDAAPYQAPTTAPYAPVDHPSGLPTAVPVPQRKFPIAAVILIGLGLLALLDTTLHLELNGSAITAFVLGAVSIWMFAHRISHLQRDYPEGADGVTVFACIVRGPALLIAVLAVLFALQAANIYTLGQTWAVIVIAFGASMLAQRAVERSVPAYVPPAETPWAPAGNVATPRSDPENGGQR